MSAFVLCLENKDHAGSLIVGKVYQTLPDPVAQEQGLLRVVDEDTSEPDGYLYPARMFVAIDVPEVAERVLLGEA